MGQKLRIFVSSSGLSALYMAIYAKRTAQEDHRDLFFVDALPLKPSQKDLTLQSAAHHAFERKYDMSLPVGEAESMVPSQRKQLTRSLKTRPGFKQVYDFLYKLKLDRDEQKLIQQLHSKAGEKLLKSYDAVELHTQPMMHLNRAIKRLFSQVEVHYFEHGLGDYLDVEKKLEKGDFFHCVFADELKEFYQKNGRSSGFVREVVSENGFLDESLDLKHLFPKIEELHVPGEKPIALIASQALEQFQVDAAYWDHFLELCLSQIEAPSSLTYLIKAHPRQDQAIVDRIATFLEEKGLEVVFWENPSLKSMNLEIIFRQMADRVAYVFSPFSSAVFYLAKLYPQSQTKYFYSLESIFPFATRTQDQYIQRWKELQPFLKEVFGIQAQRL